jgi:hypothetical protein
MEVREATTQDKLIWDSFVDDNDGNFFCYYDWKKVAEITDNRKTKRIPLIIEAGQIIGICHLVKKSRICYSNLTIFGSTGVLFRKDLSAEEKSTAISALLGYIKHRLASRSSSFIIREENVLLPEQGIEPDHTLLKNGFKLKPSAVVGLPCAHVMKLKAPFEESIWKGLWTYNLKHTLNKVANRGVVVVEDKEFKYLDLFLDMKASNYKRHGVARINRDQTKAEIEIFKDKTRLFVALEGNRPIYAMVCHYTRNTCGLWEGGSFTKGTNDVNKLVHKTVIEDACNRGYKYAHFGGSDTEGLARLKDSYKAERLPVVEYEKTYSQIRKMIERIHITAIFVHFIITRVAADRKYLWANRRMVLGKIIPRKHFATSIFISLPLVFPAISSSFNLSIPGL